MSQSQFGAIALVGNPADGRVPDALRVLSAHLHRLGVRVVLSDALRDLGLPGAHAHVPERELPDEAQLIISVGGDGTLLYAARRFAGRSVPLLGINRGRLGFLADVASEGMLERLDEVLQGRYISETRRLIRAELLDRDGKVLHWGLALNDVVVKRYAPGRMLELQTFVNGRYLNTHGGDGFIVATPTGSTAYAMSCGGPIVEPLLPALVLVPICPHTLSERPIIIPADSVTEIRLRAEPSEVAEVSCDGELAGSLVAGQTLRVVTAQECIEFVHPTGYDYFHILRTKLHWGHDSRHPADSEDPHSPC